MAVELTISVSVYYKIKNQDFQKCGNRPTRTQMKPILFITDMTLRRKVVPNKFIQRTFFFFFYYITTIVSNVI